MKCSYCDGKINVVDTTEYNGMVFRKRKCSECGATMTTREYEVPSDHSVVVKAFGMKRHKYAESTRKAHKKWVENNPDYFKEYRKHNTSKVRKEED